MTMDWIIVWALIGTMIVLLGWLIIGLTVVHIKRRREKYKDNRTWADKVNEADDYEAIQAIGDIPHSDNEAIDDRIAAAMTRYHEAGQTIAADKAERARQERRVREAVRRQAISDRVDTLRQREAVLTYEEIEIFLDEEEMDWGDLSPDDELYMNGLISRMTKQRAAELYEKVRQGDSGSLELLAGLIFFDPDDEWVEASPYQEQTGEAYVFPSDWNEHVVRLVENPPLYIFAEGDLEPEPGSVRLRAARALLADMPWQQRLVDAQIALAYADTHDDNDQYIWRKELGPVLLAEVSKLVASIHHAQGLVFTSAAPAP